MRRVLLAATVAGFAAALVVACSSSDGGGATVLLPDASGPSDGAPGGGDDGGEAGQGDGSTSDVVITPVDAAPGKKATLDPTFGNGGVATTTLSGVAGNLLVLQPDGHVVVAGMPVTDGGKPSTVVVRYDGAGKPDPTFAAGAGQIAFAAGAPVALAPSGGGGGFVLLAASSSAPSTWVARFLPGGAVDTSFEGSGAAADDLTTPRALQVQKDGQILVTGANAGAFASVRLGSASGTRDTTFGSGGLFSAHAPFESAGSNDVANDIAIAADGTLYLSGVTDSARTRVATVLHLSGAGTLDAAYGTSGFARVGSPQEVTMVSPDDSGGTVLGIGDSDTAQPFTFRLTAKGVLEPAYGSGGTAPLTLREAHVLLSDSQARTVVVGARYGVDTSLGFVRVLSNGGVDSSLVPTELANPLTKAVAGAAFQSDGKLVVAAVTGTGGLVLARYILP